MQSRIRKGGTDSGSGLKLVSAFLRDVSIANRLFHCKPLESLLFSSAVRLLSVSGRRSAFHAADAF
jgi:hypothetical protein